MSSYKKLNLNLVLTNLNNDDRNIVMAFLDRIGHLAW